MIALLVSIASSRRSVGGEGFAVDASLMAADANKQCSTQVKRGASTNLDRTHAPAIREYLATLDDAAFGVASEVTPKFISPSDPACAMDRTHKGHALFAYATNYLIDTENAVILDWKPAAPSGSRAP